MLLVLPLLPADYIRSGLEAVKKWALEKKVIRMRFDIIAQNLLNDKMISPDSVYANERSMYVH